MINAIHSHFPFQVAYFIICFLVNKTELGELLRAALNKITHPQAVPMFVSLPISPAAVMNYTHA